jgi:hypothetical protein
MGDGCMAPYMLYVAELSRDRCVCLHKDMYAYIVWAGRWCCSASIANWCSG